MITEWDVKIKKKGDCKHVNCSNCGIRIDLSPNRSDLSHISKLRFAKFKCRNCIGLTRLDTLQPGEFSQVMWDNLLYIREYSPINIDPIISAIGVYCRENPFFVVRLKLWGISAQFIRPKDFLDSLIKLIIDYNYEMHDTFKALGVRFGKNDIVTYNPDWKPLT